MAEGTFYGNFTAFAQTLTAEALYTAAGVQDAYTRSPFYAGAPALRHPRELAGLPHEPVRLQRAPARAGLRRRAARAHRFGPVPPRDRPAARQAVPEHAGCPRGVLGGEPRRDVPALRSRVVALRRAVLVSRRAADASVGARVSRADARTGLRAVRLDRRCDLDEFQCRPAPRHAPALRRGQPDDLPGRRSGSRQRQLRRLRHRGTGSTTTRAPSRTTQSPSPTRTSAGKASGAAFPTTSR